MASRPTNVPRRDFLVIAGQAGAAAFVVAPWLTLPRLAPRPTDELFPALTTQPPAALFSGLKWRMLGPFRGGRVAAATGVPGRP